MELEIKKPGPNGASGKLSAVQKPCDTMTEAIVMDGGKRGTGRLCRSDLLCPPPQHAPLHSKSSEERAEERSASKRETGDYNSPSYIGPMILQRISAPLKKADLLTVADYLIGHLSYSQVPVLAKRHKVEAKKDSAMAHELPAKQVSKYDEAELCKLLRKSAYWIRYISDPPPAAMTFSWMPPNATE